MRRTIQLHAPKAIVAVLLVGSFASAYAAGKAELASRLQAASSKSSLQDATLKPWHLKFTVQAFDAAGKPSETATIEQWTAGEDERRVYTSPSFSATEIRHGKDLFRTTGKPAPSYLLDLARLQIVDPLPAAGEVQAANPELRNESFGPVSLGCIMLDQPIKNIPFPPLGLFPTYCLDPKSNVLRFSYRSGGLSITRNNLGNFQGRSVPIDTTFSHGNAPLGKVHIDALGDWTPDAAQFNTSAGFAKVPAEILHVDPAVMQANILTDPKPIYSAIAADKLAHGTVLLRATIGADGHVRDLALISTPDPDLAVMALAVAPQWSYKPYVVDGVPVEVETEIPVKCVISPRAK